MRGSARGVAVDRKRRVGKSEPRSGEKIGVPDMALSEYIDPKSALLRRYTRSASARRAHVYSGTEYGRCDAGWESVEITTLLGGIFY